MTVDVDVHAVGRAREIHGIGSRTRGKSCDLDVAVGLIEGNRAVRECPPCDCVVLTSSDTPT